MKWPMTDHLLTLFALLPSAHTHPSAPLSCLRTSGPYVEKSSCLIASTCERPSAIGTGLRLRMDIFVTLFEWSI